MGASTPRLEKPWREKSQTPSVLDALAEQEERIAQRLRKLRADAGHPTRPGEPLPVERAAEQAKVNYRQWQRWESGKTFPRSTNLERVAETFGFDVSEFYETDEVGEPSQLDRIENALNEIHALLLGEPGQDEGGEGGLAARLLRAGGLPPKPADDPPENPEEDEPRKRA